MIMRYLWTMGKGHFTLFSGGSLARWPLQNTTTEVTKLIPWEISAFFLCQRVSLGETILGQPKRSYLKESDRCCHLSVFLPLIASQRKLDEKHWFQEFHGISWDWLENESESDNFLSLDVQYCVRARAQLKHKQTKVAFSINFICNTSFIIVQLLTSAAR